MNTLHLLIMIAMVALGTIFTRAFPFLLFPGGKTTPKYIQYLGKVLPAAALGLLVVYCFKDVSFLTGSHGIPELVALAVVVTLHVWRRNLFLSIAAGTVCYMILVQLVF